MYFTFFKKADHKKTLLSLQLFLEGVFQLLDALLALVALVSLPRLPGPEYLQQVE
jgi:hypothetical protein